MVNSSSLSRRRQARRLNTERRNRDRNMGLRTSSDRRKGGGRRSDDQDLSGFAYNGC